MACHPLTGNTAKMAHGLAEEVRRYNETVIPGRKRKQRAAVGYGRHAWDWLICPPDEPPHVIRGTAAKDTYVASSDTTEDDDGNVTSLGPWPPSAAWSTAR